MILKRKKLRNPDVGDYVKFNSDVLKKLRSKEDYLLKSISYLSSCLEAKITRKQAQKKSGLEVFPADFELMRILSVSSFNKDYVEVAPAIILNDSLYSGYGMECFLDNNHKPVYIHKSAIQWDMDNSYLDYYKGSRAIMLAEESISI